MKKHWVRNLGTAGALIAIVSVLWEYVRMRPDYQFVVYPWSARGYELVQGWVTLSIGVAALIALWLIAILASHSMVTSALIVGLIVVEATVIAAVFGNDDFSVTPGFVLIALLTLITTLVLFRVLRTVARPAFKSFVVRMLIGLVLLVGSFIALSATLEGTTISMAPWLGVLVAFVLLAALSLSSEPRELAANRMLIYSSVVAAIAIATSAGAVRSTLIRMQLEFDGIAASYKDTQVTWGHLMGVIGLSLVFLASVALWARRRDLLLTAQRVLKQREAAEASAAEIAAAQERIAQRA